MESLSPIKTEMRSEVKLKRFCYLIVLVFVLVLSVCLWPQATKPPTGSFTPSSSCCALCVQCVYRVLVLEGWQKSPSDGLWLCSAVTGDASKMFPFWVGKLSRLAPLPLWLTASSLLFFFFYFPIYPTCFHSLSALLLFSSSLFEPPYLLEVSPKCFLLFFFMHR